jgi:hypothetical protein
MLVYLAFREQAISNGTFSNPCEEFSHLIDDEISSWDDLLVLPRARVIYRMIGWCVR